MASFAWEDPLLLEDQLSEEERQIRDAAQEFAHAEKSAGYELWHDLDQSTTPTQVL